MGLVSSLLKPLKENIKYRFRWRYLWRDWFLGRHACLGYDVLKYYKHLPREVNFQKGRADLLTAYWGNKHLLPKSTRLKKYMVRDDVLPLIRQLEFFSCLPKRAPKFILMDSFAELTDQLFTELFEGWKFCSAYGDLDQRKSFSKEFTANGILPVERMKESYSQLFDIFNSRWGAVPIYFLHFPVTLETRDAFRRRHDAIVQIIDELNLDYPNLHSITIDESRVQWPNNAGDDLKVFPYHYDEDTYLAFKSKIEDVFPLRD